MASFSTFVRSAISSRVTPTFSSLLRYSSSRRYGKDNRTYLLGPSSGDSNNPGAPTMYDSRKLGHKLPSDTACPCFEILDNIPTGVFRCTTGEVLGRGAGKGTYYQNPEYFSYHHMSFYDFNISLRQYRNRSAKTGRKPV